MINLLTDGEDEREDVLLELHERMTTEHENKTWWTHCGNDSYQYIITGWKCDGHANCGNGFDEQDCEKNATCMPDYFLCDEGYNCIMGDFICDSFIDCINVSSHFLQFRAGMHSHPILLKTSKKPIFLNTWLIFFKKPVRFTIELCLFHTTASCILVFQISKQNNSFEAFSLPRRLHCSP